jgi:large subunit ribosomal protein L10
MTDVAQYKVGEVDRLTSMMTDSPVIGVISVDSIPGPQLSGMRRLLRGKADMRVTKRTFLRLALQQAAGDRKGLDKLADLLDGQVALVATEMNPFKLNKILEGTVTPTPAKGGEAAPEDITIQKGATEFKPGPIVGEFQKAGIPAAIEGGKVVVKKTVTPVKAGESIPRDLAVMLTKLNIFPLKVGLELKGLYEDGVIYRSEALHIDTDATLGNFASASVQAFNLAMFASYPTTLTVPPLLQKGHMEAMAVAIAAGIVNSATAPSILGKAYREMLAVAGAAGDGLDDELSALLSGQAAASQAVAAAPAQAGGGDGGDKKKDEPEEEEEVSEEEAAGGLGALFG